MEYFVPRSLSEFNLSGAAGDLYELAAFGSRGRLPVGQGAGVAGGAGGGGKARDKMVTFEDDRPTPGKLLADDVFM